MGGGTTTDLYYSAAWQVLEEQVGGQTKAQYVWSPVYVDALVLRDRDTNGDGILDERLYVAQDANYNITALSDTSGTIVEHYVHDPSGQATSLAPDGTECPTGSQFAWLYLHQGGRVDVTSRLYHYRHRDYSPTLGRWTSLDPTGFAAGDANLYRYVSNSPTVFTDPSGQIFWLPVLVGGGLVFWWGWEATDGLRAPGNLLTREIWQATSEGVMYVGPRVIINGLTDTIISTATFGGVDQLEIWSVTPEYREAYEWGYIGSRPLSELELALLTRRFPRSPGRFLCRVDHVQNYVMVTRGLVDIPQVTGHGGGPLRLNWSQGMLLHGANRDNIMKVFCGFFGLYGLGPEYGPENFRIAPFGNRTGHPLGELPHYHRRVPDPARPGHSIKGQGIDRHRPWETKSVDKSWKDRW